MFFVFQHLEDFKGNWRGALTLSNAGQVFYGGLLLALPSLMLYCKLARLPARRILDMVGVAAPLGLAVGRLGCFSRGCCYGRITSLPWAVKFPKYVNIVGEVVGSPPYVYHLNAGLISHESMCSMPVHPAQVYSSCISLVVFFVLLWLWKTNCAKGRLLFIYFILYALSRFCLEFVRVNETVLMGMTIPQLVSVVVALSATVAIIVSCRTRNCLSSDARCPSHGYEAN